MQFLSEVSEKSNRRRMIRRVSQALSTLPIVEFEDRTHLCLAYLKLLHWINIKGFRTF